MGMSDIKPIETVYNGYRFRSRLEARWAVFFDAAGIEYQYEPEGFVLSDGTHYLPDFYLPNVESRCGKGLWVDVKSGRDGEDLSKVEKFAFEVAQIAVLFPFDGYNENMFYYHEDGQHLGDNDYPFKFYKCPNCGIVTYEFQQDYMHHKPKCDDGYEQAKSNAHLLRLYITLDSTNCAFSKGEQNTFKTLLEKFETGQWHYWYDDFNYAVARAKQARFEHGECG